MRALARISRVVAEAAGEAIGSVMPVVSRPMRAAKLAMAMPAAPAGTKRWAFEEPGRGMRPEAPEEAATGVKSCEIEPRGDRARCVARCSTAWRRAGGGSSSARCSRRLRRGLYGGGGSRDVANECAVYPGFPTKIRDAGQARSDVAQFFAGNAPLIGRAGGIGIGYGHEPGLVRADYCEVCAGCEDATFVRLQRDLWNKGGRQGIFSNVDSGAGARIFIDGDNDGWREAGGSVAQARGEIRGGGILGGGGMGGHDDSARDVIGDAITVGVFEHPADGKWIGNTRRGRGLRRLESECAGHGQG